MDPLQRILADMKSGGKVGDRKAASQRFLDYLENDTDEICDRLDFNSVSPDKKGCEKMTWTRLFTEVRDYFRKETEKGTTAPKGKLSHFSIVKVVFSKATRNRPWLQWAKVFDFITTNLQVERQAAPFGRALVNMLENFLSIELYRTLVDSSSWIELINILLRCYGKYNINTTSLLTCLNVCIVQGSLYDEVISTLRTGVIDFYVKLIQAEADRSVYKDNLTLYLHGVTNLSTLNASEFRGLLCKLGETVIPHILQIESFTEDQQVALLEFLLVQYRLHMPHDVEMTSDAFYADDTAKWKEILRLKYAYCIDTIEDIAAKRTSLDRCDLRVRTELLMLAAKCTKQISSPSLAENNSSEDEDIDGGNNSKKKMRYKSFHTIISDVYSKPANEGLMTWLSYLTVVLNNFPELVGSRINYSNLIHLGCSLFNTNYLLRKEFFHYFLSLIRTEKSLRNQGKIDDVTDTWTTVWDLTIKSVSVCEDKEGAIELLRQILKEMHPPNVTSVLMLYINDSMPLLKCSVQLLREYLTLCSLPIQVNCSTARRSQSNLVDEEFATTPCPRMELLKWLMKVANCENVSGFEPLIATVICSIVVRQSHLLLQDDVDCNLVPENSPTEFENLLMKYSFTKLEDRINTTTGTKQSGSRSDLSSFNLIVEIRPAERLALAIKADFDSIPKLNPAKLDSLNPYKKLVTKLNLYLNILNVIETSSIGESSSIGQLELKSTLERICDNGLGICNKYIVDIFSATSGPTRNPEWIEKLIKLTRILFTTETLCDKIRSFIGQRFTQPTLELFKRFFRSNLARHVERTVNNSHESNLLILDPDLPSKVRMMQVPNAAELAIITSTNRRYENMSVEALHILIEYGLVCQHKSDLFEELMKDLLAESYYPANQFLFDAVATLIAKCTPILDAPELHKLVVGEVSVISLLQKCCRSFYQLPPCTRELWTLFKGLTPIVANIDGRGRQNFMTLVGTLYHFLKGNTSKVPRFVYEKALAAIMELSKFDRNLSWTEFTPAKNAPFWVLEDIPEFLPKKSHQIRMLAVDTICQMYENASPFDYSGGLVSSQSDIASENDKYQERRKSFLDILFQKLLSAFAIETDLTSDEKKEESANRTSLVLSCFTRLIFSFPYTQKQTIMFLFTMMKLKNIDVTLAQRALQYVSPTSTKTMCCYLPYVLKKMLILGYSIEDLPHELFGCENFHTFANRFRKEVCVEFFEQNKMPELEAFAKRFTVSSQCLIKECYGLIMAKITPGRAIHSFSLNARGVNLAVNNDIHKRLITVLGGKDVTDTLMATCLGDVVLNLISFTFDPIIMIEWNCTEVKLSEPVPPHYPQSIIQACLEFLKQASPESTLSVIGFLTKTSHQSIYKILLSLALRIHEAPDELQKYWRLHQFTFFVDLLLKEPPQIFSLMKEYVCSFVFNAYLRLLRQDGVDSDHHLRFLKVILHLIQNLVERLTSGYSSEMKIFFVPLIRSVVSASLKYSQLMDSAKTILDFLLKTHGETFADCIGFLDPFPGNILDFRDYHLIHSDKKYGINRRVEWPLSKEFERLLQDNGVGVTKGCCTKESLQFLRELLSKRKRDLERMLKNLETKRFSEECVDDPVHSIIQMLISITHDASQPQDVVLEACKCLGEIGPVDLSILVLPPYKNQGKISSMDGALLEIIKLVAGYQTSDDIQIVNVSGKVLRSLCHFQQCSQIVNVDLKNTRLSKVMLPFRSNQAGLVKSDEKVNANLLETNLGMNEMNEGIEYKTWLTKLTTGIIECFVSQSSLVANFLPLCELRPGFCEDIFPYVIYLCLLGGKTNPLVKKTVTGYFRAFFSKFVSNYNSTTETTRSFTPSSGGTSNTIIYMNKLALRLLIRVIQFLRRHQLPEEVKGNLKLTPWDNNFWLDINYLDVARAAQYCGAYFTSILYIEIAATQMDMTGTGQQSHYGDEYHENGSQEESFSQGISTYPRNKNEASKIQKLLLKAYSSIGEVDAAYGCGSARFADVQSSMHHLEQTMDWHRLLMLSNGSSISSDSHDILHTCSEQHVALSLKQLGLHNILWTFLKGVETIGNILPEDLVQVQYECGWRLSKWDLKNDKPTYMKDMIETDGSQLGFQKCIYDGIHAGLSNDKSSHITAVNNGFRSVYMELRHATLESSENIYGFLSRFQMLRVVEEFFDKENSSEDVQLLTRKWKQHDKVPIGDFKHHEPVLFLRNVLLRAYDQRNPRINLEQEINDSLLELIAKARNSGRLDLAESCATAMHSVASRPSIALDFEVAKNHWARGKSDIARDIMSKLIRKTSHDDDLYPAFLLVSGDWLSISHCERPAVILKDYLQRSCSIYEKRANVLQSDLSKAYIILAKYADAQYQNLTKYIASDVFQSKVEHLNRARADEQRLQNSVDQESKKSAIISKRHSSFDLNEINYIYKEQKTFLELALTHYLKGLNTSSDNDLLIFRAISLWLENGQDIDVGLVENTTRIFNDAALPSYKYIVVLHQLSARLGSTASKRNDVLKDILLKCARDHPYHTLPILMTQASLHKDESLPGKNSSLKVQLADRVKAAGEIVTSLRGNSQRRELVIRMENLWIALITLANTQEAARNAEGIKKPIPDKIMKCLTGLDIIAVPTTGIPVLASLNYKDCFIGIKEFANSYGLVGGINSPKKLACRGTNGRMYNMLLKGQDDLRQDAVMQQVFGVMNNLLQVEPKTKLRRLHIRTYKVIPLSQRTGLIEWVEDTQTLGEYLVGTNSTPDQGAHVRYRPNDYKPIDCRKLMQDAGKTVPGTAPDPERKYSTYVRICEHFKPVFRHFFFESFKEAGVFFEKRLAYTRSVATNSIVGYILGLGDRHVLNILIDKKTAEFVHIDLGVAFEQGRILPTPETVPFRLSRDVIDGMGISGVEGVFKKSCEETMEVLRNNAEIIITVLQVLLYDPLYMWALTNDRVAKVQPSDSSKAGRKSKANIEQPAEDSVKERNNSASRVLLRLRQKLLGIEEEAGASGALSSGSSLSVDGHVSLLIQRAVDPDKLCRLFPGWQPYL